LKSRTSHQIKNASCLRKSVSLPSRSAHLLFCGLDIMVPATVQKRSYVPLSTESDNEHVVTPNSRLQLYSSRLAAFLIILFVLLFTIFTSILVRMLTCINNVSNRDGRSLPYGVGVLPIPFLETKGREGGGGGGGGEV
jgi:hypothetical protein